jgi:hypothetical protein
MTHQQKLSPRAEYRQQENQRTLNSARLADQFPQLKFLMVDLSCFNPEGLSKSSEIRYTVNLTHARSVFRIDCPNNECVHGDFDLTEELAEGVTARRTSVIGEKCCQGWMSKTTIGTHRCSHILRYNFSLGY